MKPEWIPVFLILGFLLFQGVMQVSYPFWVLIHELGHAIPAKLSGKQNIAIQLGSGPSKFQFNFLGLAITINRSQLSTGTTTYDGVPSSTWEVFFIILTAPFVSLLATVLLATWVYHNLSDSNLLVLVVLSAFWLSNFHITFSAWWPFANPKSDLLECINHLKKNN